MHIDQIPTPALLVDLPTLRHNIAVMSEALPGSRLRPHVKAFKCTSLAKLLAEAGHRAFCCATAKEMVGMAEAGLGDDLLLANELLDPQRLATLAGLARADRARVTVAVDSPETVEAAAAAGIPEVLVDVDVGLPRCGCRPEDAGRIADLARSKGMTVRGVMGYEGHVVGNPDRAWRAAEVEKSMAILTKAHEEVGGDVVSAGGTGTYDLNRWATEIQAGSYVLMDTEYAKLGLPFRIGLSIWTTVLSVSEGWAACDAGLKALGMDHGNPTIEGSTVFFCSDEHTTFIPEGGWRPKPGEKIRMLPAHIDPTIARHERMWLVEGDEVVDVWPVDLRHW
ncbi:MAG: alanine racemase [Acidimicrobiales bacterium]|nr:MAG: alanine racemase [Acidimicrobiales bacterium]